MKCNVCNENKTEIEMINNRPLCKKCNAKKVRDYYKDNDKYKKQVAVRSKNRKIKLTKILSKIKSDNGCALCPESHSVCLDFHHLNPSEKSFEIHGSKNKSSKTFIKEIEKCEIVCSNCHRKIHANILVISQRRNIDTSSLLE